MEQSGLVLPLRELMVWVGTDVQETLSLHALCDSAYLHGEAKGRHIHCPDSQFPT